jgi:transcriptional regulator with XRE-family HTH domain
MQIGKIIEARRKELGFSLEEVGKAVGVGKSTVKKWESGAIANMRRDKIALLADKLKLDPALFIDDTVSASVDTADKTKKLSITDSLKNNSETSLNDKEVAILKLFRMVPDERQEALLETIESVLKMNGLL